METHILDIHALPDQDNKFRCDECTFECNNRKMFGMHYHNNHGFNFKRRVGKISPQEDKEKLSIELKEMEITLNAWNNCTMSS